MSDWDQHKPTTGTGLPASTWPARRRGADCLSDLVLDQMRLGELPAASVDRARAHLSACQGCAAAFARLEDDARHFTAETDVHAAADALLARHRQENQAHTERSGWVGSFGQGDRRWRRWFAPLGLATALGALWVFAMGPLNPSIAPTTSDTAARLSRSKGGFSLATYVHFHDREQPGTLHMGETLSPSDRIQFRVSSDKPGFIAILSIDQAAQVSVYYPPGDRAEAMAAGHDLPLSTAVELDETPGTEVIIGLRCESALRTVDLIAATRKAIERARAQGQAATAAGGLRLPCTETRTTVTKANTPTKSPRPLHDPP